MTSADVAGAWFDSVRSLERAARRSLDPSARAYVCGGAGDEVTVRANRRTWEQLAIQPRGLTGTTAVRTESTLFGQSLPAPILCAPVGLQSLMHPGGECEGMRGTERAGIPFIASTVASRTIEQLAAASTRSLWFQLYPQRDWSLTLDLVRRAEDAGCSLLMVTVDTPSLGIRSRERRAGVALSSMAYPNLGSRRLDLAAVGWPEIERLRVATPLPIVLKGIVNAVDAATSCNAGVDGLVVSNHGGRNLDTLPATADVLPRVVAAVQGRVPVLVDGGIRRGVDVIKALALGASAVLVGRPYLYALHLAGADGVHRLLSLLRDELETTMLLCGCTTIHEVDRSLIWNFPNRSTV